MLKPLITVDELRRLMPKLSMANALAFTPYLEAAMREHEITSKRRRCAFLAQLAHESRQLTRWEENLNYSATRLMQVFPKYFKSMAVADQYAHEPQAIANRVYANRMGNRAETSDGWKFRGRGPIGLTGRSNYRRFGKLLGVNLEREPDQAARIEVGFQIAGQFWSVGGLNELADELPMDGSIREANAFARITKRINGGVNGLSDRMSYYRVAKQVLHGDDDPKGHTPEPAPAAPALLREAESVADQEAQEESDADFLSVVTRSEKAKAAGVKLWPRMAKHMGAGFTFVWAMIEANKLAGFLVLLVTVAGVAWLVYHNRKHLKPLLLKISQ